MEYDVFGNSRSLVNEVRVGSEVVESLDAVVVGEVVVDGFLGVVDFVGDGGGVFVFEEDLLNGQGFVGDGRAHVLESAGVG